MIKKDHTNVSFLHETQQEGRGEAAIKTKKDLDEAIETVHMIINPEATASIKAQKEEDLPGIKIALYCHDCRMLVAAGVGHGRRGKMRTVCGTCKSKKISSGRKEALESFYHIKENEQKNKERLAKQGPRDFSRPPKRKFKKRPAKNLQKKAK